MKATHWLESLAATAGLMVAVTPTATLAQDKPREIPDPLKPWTAWALWDSRDLDSPTPYHDPKQALRLWPSRLTLAADGNGGRFTFEVTVFSDTWVPLPGDGELWPIEMSANEAVMPVVPVWPLIALSSALRSLRSVITTPVIVALLVPSATAVPPINFMPIVAGPPSEKFAVFVAVAMMPVSPAAVLTAAAIALASESAA